MGVGRRRSKGTYKLRDLEDLSQLQYTDWLDSESDRKDCDIWDNWKFEYLKDAWYRKVFNF